jgi:glucose/arabinose dehydrogenase
MGCKTFRRSLPKQSRRGRGLRVEALEPRVLLAGDTYLVNFQLDEATPPTRYLVDSGNLFGPRPGGFTYGWSSDHTDQARERSNHPDQRFDTLVHFEAGQNWEFQLANGVYEVTVAVGDPANNDGIHTINVEGVNFFNAVPDTNTPMVATAQVTVNDGRLTIDPGAAAEKATRINFAHIVGLPSGPNGAPAVPTITEPATNGQLVNPFDVHMEAGGFSDPDGNAHKSSDWEIWTVGPGAEPVWQTLGIEGLEKVHTHLGDGIFLNSRAGLTSLAANTDHELRVRFRDDAGAVSNYAVRPFHTTEASSTAPMQIQDVATTPPPAWVNIFGAAIELPGAAAILSPGDPIIAIDTDGPSNYPGNESPPLAIDGTLAKYLNFGEVNSGFIVTPSQGATIVKSFQITTANDAVERDPTTWQLFGTNSPILSTDNSAGNGEPWTPIASGSVTLPGLRNALGPTVAVNNNTAYTSYRMIFTGVKNAASANSMQIAEIQFYGDQQGTPHSLRLESGDTAQLMLSIAGTALAGNDVTNPPALAAEANVRVVVQSGTSALILEQTNLRFDDQGGVERTIYLPAVILAANQRLDLWVAEDGSTYYGTPAQTMPDFSLLARSSENTAANPFVAVQPGYVVEEVGSNYRLPVNIAFVPNPGPDPDDPLYYVTELYGSIQVVRRDGTKQTFATGLLDYNPQGPISGTGEQGLTGIAVQRDAVNPEIYHLYVGMLWDNGAPPGNLTHYPKVERIDSTPGGLSMATRTVLLNMQPETQGQSHQISNISIGPDGKLYVHNGDGFNAATAQNLDLFRGKILRLNLDGTAPADNPFYNAANGITARDYVFAYGVRNPFGGAWRASDGKHYEVENGPSVDRMAQVNRGVNYGYDGSNASMMINAIYNWNPSHAPVNITFVQRQTFNGSQFPASKMDRAFVSESGPTYAGGTQALGKRIVEFVLDANGNRIGGPTTLVEYRGTGQGSVVGLAAGPDGLYFTELYEDSGANGPTAPGARIYRVRYVNPPIAGDYNIDGVVDDNDYNTWRATFGSNLLLGADGNRNGIVDAADYVLWRKSQSPGVASTAALPLARESVGVTTHEPVPAEVTAAQSKDQILSDYLPLNAIRSNSDSASRGRATQLRGVPTGLDDELLLALGPATVRVDTLSSAVDPARDQPLSDSRFAQIDNLFADFQLETVNCW